MPNLFRDKLARHLNGLLLILLLIGPLLAQAQERRYTLQGRVADAGGQGLPGATVLLGGTTVGATSNADGTYTLSANLAPGSYTLTVSLVGYKTETRPLTLGSAETVTTDLTLAEAKQKLDEVVVVGSTVSVNKRELGNAISTVTAQELTQSGSGGVLNSLQGKIPGAQITQNSGDPAGSLSVRLRGVHSLTGSSDPLYVIDGVIVSNASTNVSQLALANDIGAANAGQNRLADLNPNDIASINVINGAAAAAQYGSRAANGVVLITTKRGAAGAARVSVSTSFNMNELRKSVPVNTYGKQFGFAGLRLYTIGGISAAQIAANPGTTTTNITRAGAVTPLATNLVDVTRYNYFDQIFRKGYGTDDGVSITGGSERTQYYVSANYLKNQGIIKGTDFTRYNLRARVDQRLTDWAKVSAGVSYINSFSNEKANGNVFYSPINSINITNNIYDITQRDASGNLLAVEPTRVNPLSTIEDMKFTQGVNRTVSDVQVNLNPAKGLSVDYVLGVDAYSQVGQGYIRPYPYQATAGLPAARYPLGYASNANNVALQLNSDVNVGYERQLSEDFKLNLLAGYSYQFSQQEITSTQGQNLSPFITTVSGAATSTVTSGYNLDRYDLSGIYGQATVGFRNLAFVTGAVRRDRSSKFSASETNQYYPKVSASLVVSELGFWQNAAYANAFNTLKLRASYGEAGNLTGIRSYDRFYQFNPVPFLKNAIVPGSQLANNAVRPERMGELEGGADLAFLRDRLTLGITAYYQKITDLVVQRNLAPSTGGSSIVTNVGTMENRGLELQLGAVPVKTSAITWDISLIFARNRNKVLELPGSNGLNQAISIDNAAGAPVYLLAGQPAGVFYGSGYARNADGSLLLTPQGFPQDERANGQAVGSVAYTPAREANGQPSYGTGSAIANVIIGNPNPKWSGSASTTLAYKKLALHLLFDAVQGNSVFNADKRTRQGVGLGDLAEQELRGTLPRGYIFAIYNTQEFRVDDGSYVKLREASLSYTLPTFSKFISSMNLSLVGRNLYSWDSYNGFDPETSAGGASDLLRAIDFGNVPIPRTYQLKLSATF
ncbi:SusC/RagA family TonB-linked outer membrane protein [Hymenobacter properus]|uniref:SusC/RagA family TonB-linked outer membrane protein n=1 Tax=Hymenobacter properus TaxID=2791026 RepID=A0A931BH83_9BACT|nr:SusC/RagA family TonB-linked outer membrane protein [Hymenobacter properus]MBF9142328.1 SusC/RagA family TonB-linked outer membrane protein [Hymenobacter properus]MBR7721135.1 SusC/RagA family TonB-linked outer membrane protein [Microvirga sp. SRT04]